MENLDHRGIGHELRKRRQVVDGKRVDGDALVGGCGLDQAELGVKGALAQKFGIDRHGTECGGTLAKGSELLVCGNVHTDPSDWLARAERGRM